MAKETKKIIQWSEIIEDASAESGVPKKQLAEGAEILSKQVEKKLSQYQPKKDGDSLEIWTEYGSIVSTRLPETIITDANGNKFTRPSCCAVNMGVRTSYINAANVGLVDEEAVEKASNKKASA